MTYTKGDNRGGWLFVENEHGMPIALVHPKYIKEFLATKDLYKALKAMDEYLSHGYPTNMAFKKNAVDLMDLALAKAEVE